MRHVDGPDPRRIVLGRAPTDARVHPCLEWEDSLDDLLDRLGDEGVLQLMVEGGPRTVGAFHDAGLVDRYVIYLAPALMGGTGGLPAIAGSGASTISELWRGAIDSAITVGDDIRIDLVPDDDRRVG